MPGSETIRRAGRIIRAGGVVAYPTEGVFGLGCLPDDAVAVSRVLDIKNRDPSKGLILVASRIEQLGVWIDVPDASERLSSAPGRPVTWVVPQAAGVPYWIGGEHSGIAVRITSHPVAAALCDAADSALVSTSANSSGRRPARNRYILRRYFRDLVDYIVPGECGSAKSSSEIRELDSGKVLRSTES